MRVQREVCRGSAVGEFLLRFKGSGVIVEFVPAVVWRESVASLLIEAGRALSEGQSRQASVALGTAMAYLEKARASGDATAAGLLLQLSAHTKEDATERFSFAPGELEQLSTSKKGAS